MRSLAYWTLPLGFCLAFSLADAPSAFALVDMRNANFSDVWRDLEVTGASMDLKVERTYNSKTLFNGIFGFGWCSDFETILNTTPEGNILVTQCGAGQEINYIAREFKPGDIKAAVSGLIKALKAKNPRLTPSELAKYEKDMLKDEILRQEFAKVLNVEGKIKEKTKYYALGRENEYITFSKGQYVRTLPDGRREMFNTKGRLERSEDTNGNWMKLTYHPNSGLLTNVTINDGKSLTFKYAGSANKVREILGPGNLKVTYTHSGEDLVKVKNAWNLNFSYKYDENHNLVRIDYLDSKTFKALTYDIDKDWVTSFRDEDGCLETYRYENLTAPAGTESYKSIVEKKCGSEITNQSTYEFVYKEKGNGTGSYLARARTVNNGKLTDVSYHETFGKPTFLLKDGIEYRFAYYPNGLVKVRSEPLREMSYQYDTSCLKVSQVVSKYFSQPPPASTKDRKVAKSERKLERTVTSSFTYDAPRCNLVAAANSLGQSVKINYDRKGRIIQMEDQAKKIVKLTYDERLGKPSVVSRPGLGTIVVKYDAAGDIKNVDSKQGPTVAAQVAGIFNNLLEIIAPATTDITS